MPQLLWAPWGIIPKQSRRLATPLSTTRFGGIRVEALRALGRIGGAAAEKPILATLTDDKPWVREVAAEQLGKFSVDSSLPSKLADIAANDKAYRVRVSALQSLADLKAQNAYDILTAAVGSDSPDGMLRE